MLHERIICIPAKRLCQLFCSYTGITVLKLIKQTLQSQRNAPRRHIILSCWHMIHSLSEVWNMVQCLKERIHVTSSSLVLKSNITCLLF
uniref:Ubiquitin carboxyl-terminal hydrolase 12-like isoform X10 n=1 Tax=Rhizophora mucronata TaxID=61149 RepID=A0A2P2MFJ0_RHIMU